MLSKTNACKLIIRQPHYQWCKCSAETLVSGDIRCMWIKQWIQYRYWWYYHGITMGTGGNFMVLLQGWGSRLQCCCGKWVAFLCRTWNFHKNTDACISIRYCFQTIPITRCIVNLTSINDTLDEPDLARAVEFAMPMVVDKVENYMSGTEVYDNLLHYWQGKYNAWPSLRYCAKHTLAVPTTSTAFSLPGATLSKRQTHLIQILAHLQGAAKKVIPSYFANF